MKKLTTFSLLMLLALQAQAATWRCGSDLVSSDDSTGEVLSKCGEPNERAFLGYREKVDRYGFSHEVALEEWSYGPRNGMYYFLRFEGNRLTKIDSKRGN